MEVIPAIDLKGGLCVRLFQGDFKKEEVFSDDPVAVAKQWATSGARRLHVIDLDGAESGSPSNIRSIEKIVDHGGASVQVGGGIRSIEVARRFNSIGVDRLLLGTSAFEDPDLVHRIVGEFGADFVVVSLDARDGQLVVRGWKRKTAVSVLKMLNMMAQVGVRRFVYTDITRDGTLTQPNFEAIGELVSVVNMPIIASGGISNVDHLVHLSNLGVEGAIVGKALYTGHVSLSDALVAVEQASAGNL